MNKYNAKEFVVKEGLPMDMTINATIIQIDDGKVRDFVAPSVLKKWDDSEKIAIQVVIKGEYKGEEYFVQKIFTYSTSEDGRTVISKNMSLGKYFGRYKKLPEVGDQVQIRTNAAGYFGLVIE